MSGHATAWARQARGRIWKEPSIFEPAVALPPYIADALATFPLLALHDAPWSMVTHAAALVRAALRTLGSEYTVSDAVAVHHTAPN